MSCRRQSCYVADFMLLVVMAYKSKLYKGFKAETKRTISVTQKHSETVYK